MYHQPRPNSNSLHDMDRRRQDHIGIHGRPSPVFSIGEHLSRRVTHHQIASLAQALAVGTCARLLFYGKILQQRKIQLLHTLELHTVQKVKVRLLHLSLLFIK